MRRASLPARASRCGSPPRSIENPAGVWRPILEGTVHMKRALFSTFACAMLFLAAADSARLDGNDDPPGMSVFDGDGRRIGPLINVFPPMVAFKVGGHPLIVAVQRDGFVIQSNPPSPTTTGTYMFYETTDCSGTPFSQELPDPVNDLTPRTYLVLIGGGGHALMVQDGEPRSIEALSGSSNAPPAGADCQPCNYQFVGQPIRFEANLTTARFPPPFRIRYER